MLNDFLKDSGLSFKEYEEWFLSLKKGDQVFQNEVKSSYLIVEVFPSKVKILGDAGAYNLENADIFYISPLNKFQASNFPIPSEKEIKLIKEKRSQNLWLRIGEIYEDSEGVEWTVNYTDVPFSVTGSFPCECSNPDKGIRYYTSEGKFGSMPSPFDLVKKKEKESKKEMPNIEEEPSEVKAFDIGQIWCTAWGNEATIYRTDTLGFMSARLDNRELVVYDSNGKTACHNEKYQLIKYLRDTNLIKIEIGKRYKTQSGKIITIEKSDRWYFLTTEGEYYEQLSFGAKDPIVELVEDEPAKVEQSTTSPKQCSGDHITTLIEEEPMKTESQNPQLAIGQIWENENQKEMTVVSWDEDLCKFFLVAEDGSGVWVVPSGYESWSNKKHAVKYLGETKRPRLEVGKSYYKSDEELVILVKYDNSDDTYQGDDDTWYYQFGFPYDCGGESTIVRTAENQAVENEATETKPLCLVIGDMYQTKEGEIFEVKSKEPCGRFKCLSRLGEALLYSKEGKLTPDPYNGAMDFVSQFMPEVTNSSKKKIEYFASEIEKNLKDLLDELKTEKSRAELFDENTKLFNQIRLLIKENLDLKQKLTSIKAFLEPDHK